MAKSLVDGLACGEIHAEHFKENEDRFLEVVRAIFQGLTKYEIIERLWFVFPESNELVTLKILEVAHGEKLLLVLQFWQSSGSAAICRGDCG